MRLTLSVPLPLSLSLSLLLDPSRTENVSAAILLPEMAIIPAQCDAVLPFKHRLKRDDYG